MRTNTTTPAKGQTTTSKQSTTAGRPAARAGSTTTTATASRKRAVPHFTGTALRREATERRLQEAAKTHDLPAFYLLDLLTRHGLDAIATGRAKITTPGETLNPSTTTP